MDTRRDLRFGLLALRAGLMDARQLAAAWSEWGDRPDHPLADFLLERGQLTPSGRAAIEALLEWESHAHGRDGLGVPSSDDRVRRALEALDESETSGASTDLGVHASPEAHQPDLLPGTRGRYELTRLHSSGGVGRVWLAWDRVLNREVALKELLPRWAEQPALCQRFLEEARITGQLEHPGLVPVYELAPSSDGLPPYYTMRFVKGRTLNEAIRARSRLCDDGQIDVLERASLLQAFVQVCHAVAYAHDRGVVHRDLKGQNVVLGDYGEVIVLDWGLAKLVARPEGDTPSIHDPALARDQTPPGTQLGTPSYMAPEQAAGLPDRIDRRTDVYGLGAILYEILTGRPPFTGADPEDILRRVRQEEPAHPCAACPSVPPALAAVCLRALAKEPAGRYPSAAELAREVQRWFADEPVQAYREPWGPRLARWGRRHRSWVRAGAAALLGVTLILLPATALILGAWHREQDVRRRAEHLAAGVALDRGQGLCEQGDVDWGLLWMGRGLAMAATAHAPDLEQAIRVNLAGWRPQLRALKGVLLHPDEVVAAAFQRDGRVLLTACRDGQVRSWAADTGRLLGEFRPHDAGVAAIAISPDGRTLLTAGGPVAQLWDATTRRRGRAWEHPAAVTSLAFSPDGAQVLTGGADATARLWDAASGAPIHRFVHDGPVSAVSFSPDGRGALTGSLDHTARLWDVASGEERRRFRSHLSEPIKAVAFSPDGQTVLIGSWPDAQLWDASTGEPVGPPLVHHCGVLTAAFSPDGRTVLTGSADHTAHLWDRATGRPLGHPLRHRDRITALAFSPDGQTILTGSEDHTVRLWEAAPGTPLRQSLQHESWVTAAASSPDGRRVLTGGLEQMACLWDADTGRMVRLWNAVTGRPLQGDRLAAWRTEVRRTLEEGEGKFADDPLPPDGTIWTVAFSPDGKTLLTGSLGQAACLWDAATGRLLRRFEHPGLLSLAFTPDFRAVVTGGRDQTARLWSAATGEVTRSFQPRAGEVDTVALRPDGRTVLIGGPRSVRLWDAATGRLKGQIEGHQGIVGHRGCVVTASAFSPDGRLLATGGQDRTCRLWDAATGRPAGEPLQHTGLVRAVAFSADGRILVSGSLDETARLWEVATGRPWSPPLRHHDAVTCLAFSPDGRNVLTGSDDRVARLWDVVTGKPLGPPLRHQQKVKSATYGRDGRTVLTGSLDSTARLWQAPTPIAGEVGRIALWVQVQTGMELSPDGTVRLLDAEEWRRALQRLRALGGAPLP